jgi:hypothetical protein
MLLGGREDGALREEPRQRAMADAVEDEAGSTVRVLFIGAGARPWCTSLFPGEAVYLRVESHSALFYSRLGKEADPGSDSVHPW